MIHPVRSGLAAALGLALAVPHASAAFRQPVDDQALTARDREVIVDVVANDGLGTIQSLRLWTAPAHGTAAVVGNRIRYTPAPGFTGRDRLSYSVKSGRSFGIAHVDIDVGTPLVLRGKVTDGPIANATVRASVDGHDFVAVADAAGDYAIEVIGTGDGMLTLGAQGTGSQSMVQFLSVVGDFDRVAAEAGADGELTRDENNQVQVTNVSTAQAYLLQLANGGAPVADDEALVVARERLDNGQLLTAAAAIKLVVDGGYALPAGTSDTLALISDPAALDGFLAAVAADDPEALADTINEIAADPDLTAPTTIDDLLGTYTLVYDLGVPGTVNTGFVQGTRLTLDADGTGSILLDVPNVDPGVTWSVDADTGNAVVIPNAPIAQLSYPVIPGLGQVQQRITTSRYELSMLFKGNGRDTLAVKTTTSFTYPQNPELQPGTTDSTGPMLGIRDGAGTLPLTAAMLAGTSRALWTMAPEFQGSNFTGTELFDFAADGTGARADGVGFTWSVDALGRLLVAYADGAESRYAQVSSDGRKAIGLAGEARDAGGARSASLRISFASDGFGFSGATARSDWRSGQFVSRTAFAPDNTDFYIALRDAQVGWAVSYAESGPYPPVPVGWSVAGGVVDVTYYRNGDNQPVQFCNVGVDGCYIWQVRRWRPVAEDGDRAYVIEEFLWDNDGDGDIEVGTQRANFYDRGVAPPFPTPPGSRTPATSGKTALR